MADAPRGARRVVVTGLGAVSGFGWGVDALWRGLRAGRTAIGPFDRFDPAPHRTRVAAQVPDPPADLPPAIPGWERACWADRFALAAAREALREASLPDGLGPLDAGVFFASSTAGMLEAEDWFEREVRQKGAAVAPLLSQPLSAPGDAVARRHGVTGPVVTLSSACASGALALGAAWDALRRGEVDLALAGGSDALCRVTYAGFNALRAVDPRPCRPFRADREGMSLGEGAAVLVLETEEHAAARGAVPLAELAGAGASCDAHHMTAPHPEGEGARRAILAALEGARAGADAVAFVNAHGTGTPHNDGAEWAALQAVLGDRAGDVPVEATKAAVGHLLGSAGALEAVVAVLSLRHRVLHPVPDAGPLDPALPVRLVLAERAPGEGGALSLNLAFGGANAALLLAPCPPR